MSDFKIYLEILFRDDCLTGFDVLTFLESIGVSIGNKIIFNCKTYRQGIRELIENSNYTDEYTISLEDNNFVMVVPNVRKAGYTSFSIYNDSSLYSNIEDELLKLIIKKGFISAYYYNYTFVSVESEESPDNYTTFKYSRFNRDVKYFIDEFDEKAIDVSGNFGKSLYLEKVFFVPAFQMWLGEEFMNRIGKNIVDFDGSSFKKFRKISDTLIFVQLFDNISEMFTKECEKEQIKILNLLGLK